DDRPVVKVIDFGVAKATGGTLTERAIDTGVGGGVGAPREMCPPQAPVDKPGNHTPHDGEPLGGRADQRAPGPRPLSREGAGRERRGRGGAASSPSGGRGGGTARAPAPPARPPPPGRPSGPPGGGSGGGPPPCCAANPTGWEGGRGKSPAPAATRWPTAWPPTC